MFRTCSKLYERGVDLLHLEKQEVKRATARGNGNVLKSLGSKPSNG